MPILYRIINGSVLERVRFDFGVFSSIVVDNGDIEEPRCGQCAPGSYVSVNCTSSSHRECDICPSGKYGSGKYCVDCHAGTFAVSSNSSQCDSCEAGKHSSVVSATSGDTCQECEAGKYARATAQVVCTKCASGKYSIATAATDDSVCQDCPAGSTSAPGSTAESDCTQACPPGTTGEDGAVCTDCPPNFYKSVSGNSECLSCPDYARSDEQSGNLTDCRFDFGWSLLNHGVAKRKRLNLGNLMQVPSRLHMR